MYLSSSPEPGSGVSVGIALRITKAQFASKLLAEMLDQARILSVVCLCICIFLKRGNLTRVNSDIFLL